MLIVVVGFIVLGLALLSIISMATDREKNKNHALKDEITTLKERVKELENSN